MRIENIRSEKKGSFARIVATVIWEDCPRPSQEIFFETSDEFSKSLSCNPHPFLLACTIPAMHHGEERVMIEGEICPELRDGLITAMSWIRQWYHGDWEHLVRIEAKTRHSALTHSISRRAGFFFSGGIDSLATLRCNRLSYHHKHPGSIKDGLLIGGLEVDKRETFERVISSLRDIAEDANITLIPVYTNIRDIDDDWDFWAYEWQAAALSAVAHALANRLSLAYIAASDDISSMLPLGSHPLIDPNYSSSNLRIKHDGITLSRFAKTKLIARWNVALQDIRVCTFSEKYRDDMLNCGECEKCIRTMLALLALGVLDKTRAFPKKDISKELVMRAARITPDLQAYYDELLVPLANIGRHDLVHAIKWKIAEYRKKQFKIKLRKTTIESIKAFDMRFLGNKIQRIKSLVHSHKDK